MEVGMELYIVKKLLLLIVLIAAAYITKPLWIEQVEASSLGSIMDKFQKFKERDDVQGAIDGLDQGMQSLLTKLDDLKESKDKEPKESQAEKPALTTPSSDTFSVHNIELGAGKKEVEKQAGDAQRHSMNEYGVEWFAYHDHYQNFFMASYDDNGKVNGLYTNQDLIASTTGIKIGASKEDVRNEMGKPLEHIRKGMTLFQLQTDGEHDVFEVDDSYVTIFYDKHENNTVTAIQVIDSGLENEKKDYYTKASASMKEGFEYQLFDLTNAIRVRMGESVLTWDDHVRETARKHSDDMAENNYFSHTNLDGESPFDRMADDQVAFRTAGENLAYGQLSSIFAHEGLMNSMGHRENILQSHYEYLGVGVSFNEKAQPYYTENFFSE